MFGRGGGADGPARAVDGLYKGGVSDGADGEIKGLGGGEGGAWTVGDGASACLSPYMLRVNGAWVCSIGVIDVMVA